MLHSSYEFHIISGTLEVLEQRKHTHNIHMQVHTHTHTMQDTVLPPGPLNNLQPEGKPATSPPDSIICYTAASDSCVNSFP